MSSQHHARKRVHVETGDTATFEERAIDCIFVIEWTSRFLYFLVSLHDDKKLKQTKEWKKKFYAMEHEDIVQHLNDRNVSVFAFVFMLHCMLTHLNMFSRKAGNNTEPEVKMFTTLNYDGKKAVKEWSLWALTLGQDSDVWHYTDKTAPDGTSKCFVYSGGEDAEGITSVPGIGISQLDPRNQEVLRFAHSFLKEQFSNRKLAHAHELTYPGGSFGRKPSNFLVDPLFLNGWPKQSTNPWDEDEGKVESREIVGV